ncbi:hypothetical protein BGZ76_005105, partial [Entomortierella beljakovae]
MFIRQHVIHKKYRRAPLESIPKVSLGGSLNILETLKAALRCFDKDLIRMATNVSYKTAADVYVGGIRNASVPRESVYDTELMAILANWLMTEGYRTSGQYHLRELEFHKFSDIVIKKDGKPTVVLELMATGDEIAIGSHIEKTLLYKQLIPAMEAWLVHFTREDLYFDHP